MAKPPREFENDKRLPMGRTGLGLENNHVASWNSLVVKPRADKTMLVALFEQNKQICMVNCENIKRTLQEQLQICFEMMKEIGELYSIDKVRKENLYKERDARLKANQKYVNTVVKRKAAPTEEATEPKKLKMEPTSMKPRLTPTPATM